MNEKRFILMCALDPINQNIERLNKQIDTASSKLANLNDSNSSVKQRARLRILLSTKCEERDRWQNRLDIAKNWLETIS